MITLFEKFKNKPNINLDSKFWKMVEFANWNQLIKKWKLYPVSDEQSDYFKKLQYKLYKKYNYAEIQLFFSIYDDIYYELYDYFEHLIEEINIDYEDFSDIISSIIGNGLTFTLNCLSDDKIIIDMVENNNYASNFGYLLQIEYDEYNEVLTEYPNFGYSMN